MWTKYFKLKGLCRGPVITALLGEVDFSRDDIPIEVLKDLFESDFPYLEITAEGRKEIYGIENDLEVEESTPIFESLPAAEENPDELKESIPISDEIKVSTPKSTKKRNINKREL